MPRKLMLTVDVEAQMGRAAEKYVDRLIWGKFSDGRAGIGEMMDIADRHSAKMTMFLDWSETDTYGDAIRDVGREIHRRGHDLQLHVHTDFFSEDFWTRNGIESEINLNILSRAQADAIADEISVRQIEATGKAPLAFRAGGYRYSANLLNSLRRNGVLLDTSVNVSRPTQPVDLSLSSQFRWSNDMIEVPVSNVMNYRNCPRPLNFNFNISYFPNAGRMHEYLDNFWSERGDEAIAVLVLHSWSLLKLPPDGLFRYDGRERSERFDEFLSGLGGKVEFVTATDVVERDRKGELALDPVVDLGFFAEAQMRKTEGNKEPRIAYTASSSVVAKAGYTSLSCPVCGASKGRFAQLNGPMCPDCGSDERQRSFAVAYENGIRPRFNVSGKTVLIFGPCASELRFLNDKGLASGQRADMRRDVKPDIVLDICAMPSIKNDSREFVFASGLMPTVDDMGRALDEVERILAPGGAFILLEPLQRGSPESWRGAETPDKDEVAPHGTPGETDYAAELERRFAVERFAARDPITGQVNGTLLCWSKKPGGAARSGVVSGIERGQIFMATDSIGEVHAAAEALWADQKNFASQKRSVELFHRLYALGDKVRAGYRLGTAYYLGRGVTADLDKSYEFLSIPELDKIRFALYFRGLLFNNQKFAGFDEVRALETLNRAQEMGVEIASEHIAAIMARRCCPICDTVSTKTGERVCPGCGSREGQRVFMLAYRKNIQDGDDISGKKGLLVSPSAAERTLLTKLGVNELTTIDAHPNAHPDIIGDICSRTSLRDDEFDFVFASYVLPGVRDLDAALKEFHRVLKPGGVLLTIDPIAPDADNVEIQDLAVTKKRSRKSAYDKYKVGSLRRIGRQGLIDKLTPRFETQVFSAADPLTKTEMSVFLSRKVTPHFSRQRETA